MAHTHRARVQALRNTISQWDNKVCHLDKLSCPNIVGDGDWLTLQCDQFPKKKTCMKYIGVLRDTARAPKPTTQYNTIQYHAIPFIRYKNCWFTHLCRKNKNSADLRTFVVKMLRVEFTRFFKTIILFYSYFCSYFTRILFKKCLYFARIFKKMSSYEELVTLHHYQEYYIRPRCLREHRPLRHQIHRHLRWKISISIDDVDGEHVQQHVGSGIQACTRRP